MKKHKSTNGLHNGEKRTLCKFNFALPEHLSYYWKNVTCKNCLKYKNEHKSKD